MPISYQPFAPGGPIAGGAVTATSLTVAGNGVKGSDDPQIPGDHGFTAWSFPIYGGTAGGVLAVAGTLYLTRIRRVPAGTISNITVHIGAAGVTLTVGQCFAALFDAAGALRGVTADQAAAWGSTGIKTMALTSPYVNAAGDYYAGFWFNGTTGPNMMRGSQGISGSQINPGMTIGNYNAATSSTGLTTTPPDPFAAQTASTFWFWVALS